VGHGQVESSLSDSRYYDTLLDYTRKGIVTRATNGARYSSKTGKNVAPNALSLFLQPAFFTTKFEQAPSLFSNPFFFDSVRSSVGSLNSRLFTSEVEDKLTTRLLELLDESGVAANVALNQAHDNGGCGSDPALGISTSAANLGTSILSANNTWNYFFCRGILRDDMLRYRAYDALRTKSTLVLSSNRLVLIYRNYLNWATYLQSASNTHNYGVGSSGVDNSSNFTGNSTSSVNFADNGSIANTVFFVNNWAIVQQYASFIFRYLHTGDGCNTAPNFSISPTLNVDLFGQYNICTSNITINTWLLFFNAERYLLSGNFL
jgi:hypothetical protein